MHTPLNPPRSLALLAALSALALCGLSAGCSQDAAPAKPETAGNYVDDTAITTKVKAALLADDAVKSLEISVATAQGVVHLTGSAPTADQKTAAGKDAAGVAGVKDVSNDLKVGK